MSGEPKRGHNMGADDARAEIVADQAVEEIAGDSADFYTPADGEMLSDLSAYFPNGGFVAKDGADDMGGHDAEAKNVCKCNVAELDDFVTQGLLENKDGLYYLTEAGKKMAERWDDETILLSDI